MENANGKKRVCEAVMEFLRLACVYSGYIHAYAAMAQAPFSVLLVVSERHEAVSWAYNLPCMYQLSNIVVFWSVAARLCLPVKRLGLGTPWCLGSQS